MAVKPLRNKTTFPSKAANAIPRIGNIKGATIIAPIMTAVLLESNPKVAIMQEPTIKTR